MSSPTFGMLPGNNAPPPPLFAGNNPTGMLPAGSGSSSTGNKGMNSNFPNYPMFGNPSAGPLTAPAGNAPIFGNKGMQGLSTGLNGSPQADHKLYKELINAYGPGAGDAIFNELLKGSFNPQVASAFLNAMQPGINRGEQDILSSFSAEGSRFSSSAALGEGNFLSQANLNEQQTLASMYMQAQQQDRSFLEGILPTLHAEQANKGGFWSDVLGGLEIAGGVAMEFVPGLQAPGAMLIGSGVGTLAGGLSGGGGGKAQAPIMPQQQQWSTPPFFDSKYDMSSWYNNPSNTSNNANTFWDTYAQDQLTASAGDAVFAS